MYFILIIIFITFITLIEIICVLYNLFYICFMFYASYSFPRQVCREFKLNGDCLEQVVYMATSNTPDLTEHLRAKYRKASEVA